MIVVSGIITIDPAKRAGALALIEPLVAAVNEEEGCISYDFWEDPSTPGRFRLFEEWTSQDALSTHFGQPHMATFQAGVGELGGMRADISKYVVSSVGPVR